MWKTGNKYSANGIGTRANTWPTLMSTLKKGEKNCSRNT